MRLVPLIFFHLLFTTLCFTQNLVPNPSFESIKKSSKRWSRDAAQFDTHIKLWNSPTQGSPDLLNVKLLGQMFPVRPKVDLTPYQPRTGDFMVGIKTYGCHGRSRTLHCKEYLQIELTESLVAGKRYYFEYWVLPIERSVKVNSFGLVADEYELKDDSIYMELDVYPVVDQSEIIAGANGQWQKISGEFEAAFDAKYIIIGIFKADAKMKVKEESGGLKYGYYLLDDVFLEALNVNKDVTFEINKALILENILFEFDKAIILNEAVEVLDQLVIYLNKYPALNIEISGHTDDQGEEGHNKKLSKARADAVGNYLEERAIGADRIKTFGWGSEFPIVENSSEENRAENRRVALKLLE